MSAARRERRRVARVLAHQRGDAQRGPRILGVGIQLPAQLFPWERELLLVHVEELLESVLVNLESDGDEEE